MQQPAALEKLVTQMEVSHGFTYGIRALSSPCTAIAGLAITCQLLLPALHILLEVSELRHVISNDM